MLINTETYARLSQKKQMFDKLRPFSKGALAKLKESIDVEMTYNSTNIEGNTLTLGETRLVLEEGITIGGKSLKEHLELTNHKKAIDFVESLVKKEKITPIDILNLHAIILDKIDPENAGFYRKCAVRISGTTYNPPSPNKVPELMREVHSLLNSKSDEPIETAAIIHLKFVDIHPFVDGNGRVARLLLNLYLMRNSYPPTIIQTVERKKYIQSIVAAQTKKDCSQFVNFVAKAVEHSLDVWLDCLGNNPKEYMTLAEAANHSRYSQEYLSLLARKGRIDAIKFGRNWKISKEALQAYEQTHRE